MVQLTESSALSLASWNANPPNFALYSQHNMQCVLIYCPLFFMQYNKRSARIKILLQNTKKQTSSTCCQTDISLKNVATKDNTSTTSIFNFCDGYLNALHNGVKVYEWIFMICMNIFGLFCSELKERLVIPLLFN